MRYSLLPTLGLIASLGVPVVFADVLCDKGLDHGINNTATAIVAKDCIERVCSDRVASHHVSEECGSVIFAITHVGSSLPDVATCKGQFNSIVDQCIVSGVAQTGIVATEQAIYEIRVEGGEDLQARRASDFLEDDDLDWEDIVWDDEHDSRSGLESRDDDEEDDEVVALERRARKKGLRTKTKSKSRKPKKKTTKPNPKKTKAKTDAKKAKKQECKKPKAGGKGAKSKTGTKGKTKTGTKTLKTPKKTTRDLIDDYLPQLFRRTSRGGSSSQGGSSSRGSSSSQGQACELPDVTQWYKTQRFDNNVKHYRFKTRSGWRENIRETRVKDVMKMMNDDGKLDVIEMRNAHTAIVGESNGKTNPHDYNHDGGKYLLCNGGFFIMGGAGTMRWDVDGDAFRARDYDHYAVGSTSVTRSTVPIPRSQAEHYGRLEGDDGSWLWSGPKLSRQLDFSRPELQYFDSRGRPSAYTQIPGGVATANQPNERLVSVVLPNGTKYIFVYTSERRRGCELNRMRELIKIFLEKYVQFNIRSAHQVLNLDGGGSIYVSWVERGREYVIAGGNINGVTPARIPNPRVVSTMVKFTVR